MTPKKYTTYKIVSIISLAIVGCFSWYYFRSSAPAYSLKTNNKTPKKQSEASKTVDNKPSKSKKAKGQTPDTSSNAVGASKRYTTNNNRSMFFAGLFAITLYFTIVGVVYYWYYEQNKNESLNAAALIGGGFTIVVAIIGIFHFKNIPPADHIQEANNNAPFITYTDIGMFFAGLLFVVVPISYVIERL